MIRFAIYLGYLRDGHFTKVVKLRISSYRKALRMMKYADHHGFPIVTFVDTPGAFADLKSEELGQVYGTLFVLTFELNTTRINLMT